MMTTFLSAKKKPISDRTALAALVVGTVGLLVTVAALNGGIAPTASAWDGIRVYLASLLSSSWVLVLAFIALVAAVWQIAHGRGYGSIGLILGILAVALIGPGVVTAAATATRSPVAIEQAAPAAGFVAPVALKTASLRS